jgi:putative membrane protein
MAFGGDLGIAYVGAQGDPWDAQKDMSLAALGAVLATGATAAGHRRRSSEGDRLQEPRPRS